MAVGVTTLTFGLTTFPSSICSQSIYFFLARSSSSNGPSTRGRLDFDSPYICGFGESRPDDSAARGKHPSKAAYPAGPSEDVSTEYPEQRGPSEDVSAEYPEDRGHLRPRRGLVNEVTPQYPDEDEPRTRREYDKPTKQSMMANLYQHPHKRANPQNLYRTSFDVYS